MNDITQKDRIHLEYILYGKTPLDNGVISVSDLNKATDVKHDMYLGRYEVNYYHFLEKNADKAYTFWEFVKGVSEDTELNLNPTLEPMLDYEYIDNMLKKMVEEGKIHGAYFDGAYFYYF